MKLSVSAALLIVAIAIILGSRNHQVLTHLRAQHGQLAAQARALGPSAGSSATIDTAPFNARRARSATRKLTAAEIIAFAEYRIALQKAGQHPPDEEFYTMNLNHLEGLHLLSPTELKSLLAELNSATDLDPEIRALAISEIIGTLLQEHSREALPLFLESPELHEKHPSFLPSCLTHLARHDPLGAVEWFKTHQDKFPGLANQETKIWILQAASAEHPVLALNLIRDLELTYPNQVVVDAIRSHEDRGASLIAFRNLLDTITDPEKHQIIQLIGGSAFFHNAAADGFESATRWLESADFSDPEIERMAGYGLARDSKAEDLGKWIGWLGENLPPENSSKAIGAVIQGWTEKDYQAAGQWLVTAPEGPVKNAAIRSYAETVAPYEPETAARWALTLPPGETRDESLRGIHGNWSKRDPAAAAAFAEQHGIP